MFVDLLATREYIHVAKYIYIYIYIYMYIYMRYISLVMDAFYRCFSDSISADVKCMITCSRILELHSVYPGLTRFA